MLIFVPYCHALQGKPYVMFGNGELASCKPISEQDLAAFIADCVQQEKMANKVGGRGLGREGACGSM